MLKDAWKLAIETLSQIELQKVNEHLALARVTRKLGINNPNAIMFAYRLVIETVRQKNLIDKFIDIVLKPKTFNELNPRIQAFLELYVYQTRAAENWSKLDLEEAERITKLARAILKWKTLRVIEPYLGSLLTRKIEPIVNMATDEERVALRTFHPVWFVNYCFRLLGRNEALAFLEGSIYPPPVFLRLNMLKAPQEQILEKLAAEGITLEKTENLKHAYKVIRTKKTLTKASSYCEGLFYVQDKASCFAAEVADPQPGMKVLDVCAAPGAKTTYLAQLMQNQGEIYSVDYSARRMRTWKKEVSRMGVATAQPIMVDSRVSIPVKLEADIIVLDPPCTGTGVFGRIPSAKWRLTEKSIEKMTEIQWQMINNVAENVTSGGILAYSTCSIMVEENEMIIERFLKWHPEFSLTKISPQLGLPGLRGLTKCQRLYPHLHESNGFFIAKMLKKT